MKHLILTLLIYTFLTLTSIAVNNDKAILKDSKLRPAKQEKPILKNSKKNKKQSIKILKVIKISTEEFCEILNLIE